MINFVTSFIAAFILLLNFSGKPADAFWGNTEKVSFEADEDQILWQPEYRLSWDDFLCEPLRNTEAVALTSTTLGLAYRIQNGKLSYNINCGFSKKRSWALLKTPYILAHEQAHFDITEIYARKLNQQLKETRFSKGASMQGQVNAIYEKMMKEKEAFQELYDGETSHSRNKAKQAKWLNKIDEMLAASQPYAAYP